MDISDVIMGEFWIHGCNYVFMDIWTYGCNYGFMDVIMGEFLRGGIPRPIENFPESLSQRIFVGIILVWRLTVQGPLPGRCPLATLTFTCIGWGFVGEKALANSNSERTVSDFANP